MSKLDNIILDCANKVLDGKEEKLGDYIDPTKEQVKALMLELIGDDEDLPTGHHQYEAGFGRDTARGELRKKVEKL